MCVLDMVIQAIGCRSVEYWLRGEKICANRVSIIILHFSLVALINRVTLLIPPLGNAQIGFRHFSPDEIRKIFLMWSLVRYRSSIYMFCLIIFRRFSVFHSSLRSSQFQSKNRNINRTFLSLHPSGLVYHSQRKDRNCSVMISQKVKPSDFSSNVIEYRKVVKEVDF